MPLYEYACEKCGDRFEVMQKFSDEPLTTHEKCGGPVQRLISAPALQFKGSGWYVTDYAKGSTSTPSTENGSPGKSDTPSESKSAKSDTPAAAPATSASSSESKNSTSSESK
jgi:putative FmdB family regulatory protein